MGNRLYKLFYKNSNHDPHAQRMRGGYGVVLKHAHNNIRSFCI